MAGRVWEVSPPAPKHIEDGQLGAKRMSLFRVSMVCCATQLYIK